MAKNTIDQLCRSVLPAEFAQIVRDGPRVQNFLEQNLPLPDGQSVTVLSVNETEIVVAAETPGVANFLRFHIAEIQQQLREGLQMTQQLKFCALPNSLLQLKQKPIEKRPPRQVSPNAVDAIKRNAEWIEDDQLKAAMLSLANSLKSAQ